MVEQAEGQDGRGQKGRHKMALFYMDGVMIASPYPGWLQGAFRTMVAMFNRVGLRMNVEKTVGMV